MTAALRFLLAVLAGGLTYGGLTVTAGIEQGPAVVVALIVAALAAWLGPRALRAAVEAWDS